MSEYIKREDAIKEANTWSMFGNDNLESRLKRLPSADVEPVRHGRWLKRYVGCDAFVCSECGTPTIVVQNYCCKCGARMDG